MNLQKQRFKKGTSKIKKIIFKNSELLFHQYVIFIHDYMFFQMVYLRSGLCFFCSIISKSEVLDGLIINSPIPISNAF